MSLEKSRENLKNILIKELKIDEELALKIVQVIEEHATSQSLIKG